MLPVVPLSMSRAAPLFILLGAFVMGYLIYFALIACCVCLYGLFTILRDLVHDRKGVASYVNSHKMILACFVLVVGITILFSTATFEMLNSSWIYINGEYHQTSGPTSFVRQFEHFYIYDTKATIMSYLINAGMVTYIICYMQMVLFNEHVSLHKKKMVTIMVSTVLLSLAVMIQITPLSRVFIGHLIALMFILMPMYYLQLEKVEK